MVRPVYVNIFTDVNLKWLLDLPRYVTPTGIVLHAVETELDEPMLFEIAAQNHPDGHHVTDVMLAGWAQFGLCTIQTMLPRIGYAFVTAVSPSARIVERPKVAPLKIAPKAWLRKADRRINERIIEGWPIDTMTENQRSNHAALAESGEAVMASVRHVLLADLKAVAKELGRRC